MIKKVSSSCCIETAQRLWNEMSESATIALNKKNKGKMLIFQDNGLSGCHCKCGYDLSRLGEGEYSE